MVLKTIGNKDPEAIVFSTSLFSMFETNELPELDLLDGSNTLFGFYDSELVGFACCSINGFYVLIRYFYVEPVFQNRGFGSKMISLLQSIFLEKTIIVSIKNPFLRSGIHPKNLRRYQFYVRAGFRSSSIFFCWKGCQYMVLSYPRIIQARAFYALWDVLNRSIPINKTKGSKAN